jgi:uncharacterized alpha-E superfamily protein
MTVLLARSAGRLYWGARYVERAEDTARVVRAYHELVVDDPSEEPLRWEPLAVLAGSNVTIDVPASDPAGERTVLHHLLDDHASACSIASSIGRARENFRTTREVMPREAWQAINQLSQYVEAAASGAVDRQLRNRFLVHVVEISRRLDGILESTMTRSEPYHLIRLGRLVERADMTTRVLGVAAAGILTDDGPERTGVVNDEVRWMSVLRSVSALQMYQRATHGPIDGMAVVRFLLAYGSFPRSVTGCFEEMRRVLDLLPSAGDVIAALDRAQDAAAAAFPDASAGAELDHAMETVQSAICDLHLAIHARYVDVVM